MSKNGPIELADVSTKQGGSGSLSADSLDLLKDGRDLFTRQNQANLDIQTPAHLDIQPLLANDSRVPVATLLAGDAQAGPNNGRSAPDVQINKNGETKLPDGSTVTTKDGMPIKVSSEDGKAYSITYKDGPNGPFAARISIPPMIGDFISSNDGVHYVLNRMRPASIDAISDFKLNNDGSYSYTFKGADGNTFSVQHKTDNSTVTTNKNGDVVSVQYSNGNQTSFTYDSLHNVVQVIETSHGKYTTYTPNADPDKPWNVNGKATDGLNPPSGSHPVVEKDGTYHWKGGDGKDYVRTTNGHQSDKDPNPPRRFEGPLHTNASGAIDNIKYPEGIGKDESGQLNKLVFNGQEYHKENGKWYDKSGKPVTAFKDASLNPQSGCINLMLPDGRVQFVSNETSEMLIGTTGSDGSMVIKNSKGQITEIDHKDGTFRQISYKPDGSLNRIDLEDKSKISFENNKPYLNGVELKSVTVDANGRTVTIIGMDGKVTIFQADGRQTNPTDI